MIGRKYSMHLSIITFWWPIRVEGNVKKDNVEDRRGNRMQSVTSKHADGPWSKLGVAWGRPLLW